MKQEDIQIGVTYLVGLAGNLVPVLITNNHPSGTGWHGKTVKTGKQIVIRSAQRIHKAVDNEPQTGGDAKSAEPVAKQSKRKPKATTDTTDAKERDTAKPAAIGGDQKPMSLINAAAYVLAQGNRDPMRCKEIVEQTISQNLWQAGKGLTPASTLYAAIGREIKTKGDDSRFHKAERGKFTVATKD